jgi:signal transduction histidine kinase/CheY-like chemotaxis protein
MDEATAGEVFAAFNRVYRTGRPESGFNWETLRLDGSRAVVETSISLRMGARGEPEGFRGLVRDVTDRERDRSEKRRLEAQLQHAQRMEAIGTLAGGIAHNFNNLLMGIQGNASLMTLDLDPDHPHLDRLKTIEKLVRSGSELTRQLLGYAREGRYEVRAVDLNQLVRETAGTFGAARKEIRVHTDLPPSLPSVLADRGQIEQALMNLFVNAADAMSQGGDLFVTTKKASRRDMGEKPYESREGAYVLLVVRDTGQGMDEETKAKIFEPFFTTKGLSRGTGLGLASVYGIVKAHGGYIEVASEVGIGTTFEIHLPATQASAEVSLESDKTIDSGSGTVLLVDDEETVLAVGAEMLSRMRYTVLQASGGEEAVRLFQEAHEGIDLVILDLIMPDMGGGEVFDRLTKIDPSVKVLLASGYSMDGKAAEILKRGCDDFIQKPFDMALLSQKVNGLLNRS